MADRRSRTPRNSRDNVDRVDADADEDNSGDSSTHMPGRYATLHRDPDPEPRPHRVRTGPSTWKQTYIEPESRRPSDHHHPFKPRPRSRSRNRNGYRTHYPPIPEPHSQYPPYPNYDYEYQQQPMYPPPIPPYQGPPLPHAPMPPTNYPPARWDYPPPFQGPPYPIPFQPGFQQPPPGPHNPNAPNFGFGRGRDGYRHGGQGDPGNWSTVSNAPSTRATSSVEDKLARVQRELKKVRRENHDAKVREQVRADAARQVDAEIMRLRRETSLRGDSNQSEVGFDMMRVPRNAMQLYDGRQGLRHQDRRLSGEMVYNEFGEFVGYLN